MTRDRAIRVGVGVGIGAVAGTAVYGAMSRMDMSWEWGPRQPIIAAACVGVAIAALITLTASGRRAG